MKHLLVSLFIVTGLVSCSKRSSSQEAPLKPALQEYKGPQKVPETDKEVEFTGQFMAPLETVNEIVADKVTGVLTISREGDEFVGDVNFSGGPLTASILHSQGIYEGKRCPTTEDDVNQDGFIDAVEGEAAYGKLLIPLDADLNAQHLELGTYPVADQFGNYTYSEAASFTKFLDDLKEVDINPNDTLVKLDEEASLKFAGKVIVVLGIASEAHLPDSVATNSRLTNYQALPIACGVLHKIADIPGTVEHDKPRARTDDLPGGPAGIDDGATIVVPPEDGTATTSTDVTGTSTEASNSTSGTISNYGEEETTGT